ncbi:hypothetical protein [Alsobacter sp. R-9]
MAFAASRADALSRLTQLLPDRDRMVVETDGAVRDVALQLVTRFSIGDTWIDVDALPGEEEEGWRSVDEASLSALAGTWIQLGAPVRRMSDYIAVALLRVTAARIVASLARERRRLRMARIALHASCGVLTVLLIGSGAVLRAFGHHDSQVFVGGLAGTIGVWLACSAVFAGRQRMHDGRSAAVMGLFVRRVQQAATEIEEQRADRAVVMRRLRGLDSEGRLPEQLWPLLGAPVAPGLWEGAARTTQRRG